MHFTIKVEWQREDGDKETAELATVDVRPCQAAGDVGLQIADGKQLLSRLQELVVGAQLRRHCEEKRSCPVCHRRRNVKDHRRRRLYTVFGRLNVSAPRFDACQGCGEQRMVSPVSDLLPERVSPELRDLQVKLAADLSYRRASAILRELLPDTAGFNHATTRNRTLAVGKRIEQEICDEIDHPRTIAEPAQQMIVGIDGAFVKAVTTEPGQRHQFEILTGRIETTNRSGGEAFAVVRDLDRAKQKVQAVLRRSGRDAHNTELTILSDGEDGLRGVVGWFGKNCTHRLDWFHVARRIERIRKDFLDLPCSAPDDFGKRLAERCADINSMKWMLWNDGIEMGDFGMTRVRIGLFQHAFGLPDEVSRKPFQTIEAKLDELRSYLYANRESTEGYAESYRKESEFRRPMWNQP